MGEKCNSGNQAMERLHQKVNNFSLQSKVKRNRLIGIKPRMILDSQLYKRQRAQSNLSN